MIESLLTVADGRFGTRGSAEEAGDPSTASVIANGVYERTGDHERLLRGPLWIRLVESPTADESTWVLDLRRATVRRIRLNTRGRVESLRFASLARPGWMGMRAEGPGELLTVTNPIVAPPTQAATTGAGVDGHWMSIRSPSGGGIVAAACDEMDHAEQCARLDRLAVYVGDDSGYPDPSTALTCLAEARELGFDRLLDEHAAAWEQRWQTADIEIDGAEQELQAAVRFSLYHLMASVADSGEAAVGARGLSGPSYDGHVFWDADVFVLPFLAATHSSSARAMLQYRIARLGAARRAASEQGSDGARFPWESAASGSDVTPRLAHTPDGRVERIFSGEHEEHIVADVAWACVQYLLWTGDDEFARRGARTVLRDTANYWTSRIRRDRDGVGHLYGVVGPDEYHDVVDDNAFTNIMARWNLRAAAAIERQHAGSRRTVEAWETLAASLCTGFDPATRRHEQFAGYAGLEPLLAVGVGALPVAADLVLGRRRVRGSQLIKQPDVLMAHHLVPEEMEAGSLGADVDFYLPRTVHGSSLSPAICAAVLARAGRPDEALSLLRLATRIDLDDLTGTTAGGLHLAAMGGVWQALVAGFLGVRPAADHLAIDPHLPTSWRAMTARITYRGVRTVVRAEDGTVRVDPAGDITVRLGGLPRTHHVGPSGATFSRTPTSWRRCPP